MPRGLLMNPYALACACLNLKKQFSFFSIEKQNTVLIGVGMRLTIHVACCVSRRQRPLWNAHIWHKKVKNSTGLDEYPRPMDT
jgi:hypothetical protein